MGLGAAGLIVVAGFLVIVTATKQPPSEAPAGSAAAHPLDKQRRFQILTLAEARRNAVTILREAAAVHLRQENSLESELLLLRAVVLDPFDAEICRALAALYRGAGMFAEQRVVLRRLVEIEPSNPVHYLDLAKVSAQLGEPESAEAALKLAIAVRPQASDGYAVLAQFYLQAGKAKQARWFAQEALRREPTSEGYEFLASACRALGQEADAEAALAMARKLEPVGPRRPQAAPQRPQGTAASPPLEPGK